MRSPIAALALAAAAALAACSAAPVISSPPPTVVRLSSASPAPQLSAVRSWWTAVRPDVNKLAADLGTGSTDPAALVRLRGDVSALQADPGYPSGDPAAASAWHTALADYASAVASLQEHDAADADTLFSQGTSALNTVMTSITKLTN